MDKKEYTAFIEMKITSPLGIMRTVDNLENALEKANGINGKYELKKINLVESDNVYSIGFVDRF